MPQKQILLAVFTLMALASCTASRDPMRSTARQLQKGIIKEDTSFAYSLPFKPGESHLVVQGYFSKYSHKNRVAIDFKMKKGTNVYAARGGVIVRVKIDGNKGGWNKKYRPYGNNIVIQHEDGSRAGYWHLKYNGSFVKIGDTIQQGQLIGLSGRTGYALFPHLHFLVWRNGSNGQWLQIPTRFKTSKGIIYLRPLRRYRNPQ